MGFAVKVPAFDLLLPVGISFYTFQALSYTIDVYRKDVVPEKNIFRYALFVSFFPQLVAGPIERSGRLLTQLKELDNRRLWSYDSIVRGCIVAIWGFFLKMVISDRISIFVDTVWDNYQNYGTIMLLLAACGFSIQIYCDFAGYSAIAIGVSKIMGINLMENFDTPYFSRNIKEFWRRWHISLSTWFKDYLYIPLGGSRCTAIRNSINIMITFLISGLWHGAGWRFVIWGGHSWNISGYR
jgi:D-alanyl-lipoteichoic acid acyltransferase DltB (MBOAT superfamily)